LPFPVGQERVSCPEHSAFVLRDEDSNPLDHELHRARIYVVEVAVVGVVPDITPGQDLPPFWFAIDTVVAKRVIQYADLAVPLPLGDTLTVKPAKRILQHGPRHHGDRCRMVTF